MKGVFDSRLFFVSRQFISPCPIWYSLNNNGTADELRNRSSIVLGVHMFRFITLLLTMKEKLPPREKRIRHMAEPSAHPSVGNQCQRDEEFLAEHPVMDTLIIFWDTLWFLILMMNPSVSSEISHTARMIQVMIKISQFFVDHPSRNTDTLLFLFSNPVIFTPLDTYTQVDINH